MTGAAAAAQSVDWLVNLNDSGSDPIAAGGTIAYNLRVENNGLTGAPATSLTIAIPAATIYRGVTGGLTGCTAPPVTGPATITCPVPALAVSAPVLGTLLVETTQAGTIDVVATIQDPTNVDPDPSNDSATEPTTVTRGADLALAISGPSTVASGGRVTLRLTVTNNGPDAATGSYVEFPVPAGLSNLVLPTGCTRAGTLVTCQVSGTLADGASASFDIAGQVAAASGSTITAVGTAQEGTPPDPLPDNDQARLNISVTAGSDLRITKTRSPAGALVVGNPVTFTLASAYSGDVPTAIEVTDTVPDNYRINSVTASGWSCAVSGQTVTCTLPAGTVAGANVALPTITIATTTVRSGSAQNTAVIDAAGPPDPDLTNNRSSDAVATIADQFIDLATTKTGPSPALVVVGTSTNFVLTSRNAGNVPFFGTLVLTERLPAGLTATAVGGTGWTCVPPSPLPVAGPADIVCSRVYTAASPLAAGASAPPVTVTTLVTATGRLTNSAVTTSPDGNLADPVATPASATVTASLSPASADVAVIKTASPATVAAGDIETFRIEVTNQGPSPALQVRVTDTLQQLINNAVGPTGAGFIDAVVAPGSATGASCASATSGGTGRALTCNITTLPICTPGSDCPVITVRVRPGGAGGSRSNTAVAASQSVADPATANNQSVVSYTVLARTDVTVTKVASPTTQVAGQQFTYVVTASNIANGLSSADNVTVEDTLPAGLVFVSVAPSAGTCTTQPAANVVVVAGVNDRVICNLGTIAPGAQRTMVITVRPTNAVAGTPPANQITNRAVVTTTTTEIDTTNNSTALATEVTPAVIDLLVNKTDSVDPVVLGQDTTYTITVRNLGPSAAERVVVTDTLPPAQLAYRSFSAPAGTTCSTVPAVNSFGGTLSCSIPVLLAGQSRAITVVMRGAVKGVTTNTVRVTSDETAAGRDTNPANNQVNETTTVRTRADVAITSKTASPATVNLRDAFTWTIVAQNLAGAGLSEADGVEITDALPAGMELTGTPTIVVNAGTITGTTCTGASGATAFACSVGTMSSGARITISAPVRVVSVTANPQQLDNRADITTTSFDVDPANNAGSGTVTVQASSLAGRVFRDADGNGTVSAPDTGIGGVTMTLTGQATDGTAITRTTTTAPDGSYAFDFLPAGSYAITEGPIAEPFLLSRPPLVGGAGGTSVLGPPDAVTGIALAGNRSVTGYDFPETPQARIGLAKRVTSGPTVNADGTFDVAFEVLVANLGSEDLRDVLVTDGLAGASPLFGTYVTGPPALPGRYTVTAAPAGSCTGLVAGFNGSAERRLVAGGTLAAGAQCSVTFAIRVLPTAPLPPVSGGGRYLNQATGSGTGALTGQTPASNPLLTDLSNDGSDTAPTPNAPTPVSPDYAPSIALDKVASLASLSDPVQAGDRITYTFTVTNTGNLTLANVTIADALPGVTVTGGPITLAPGAIDSTTFQASYALTAADLSAGRVVNTATATGTADGTRTVEASDSVDTTLAAITLVKTADTSGLSSPPRAGQVITYRFTVQNTGGTPLRDVSVADALAGVEVTPAMLALLPVGATDSSTFTGTYRITADDIAAGQLANTATVTGRYGVGNALSVSAQSGTSSPLAAQAGIDLLKTANGIADTSGDGVIGVGDTVSYRFDVTNTGNVALADVRIADPRATVTGGPVTLPPGATDTTSFAATYVLTQADLDRGYADNSATVTGGAVDSAGTPIEVGGVQIRASDVSDTGSDASLAAVVSPATTETPGGGGTTDTDPTNDPTPVRLTPVAGIELVKSVASVDDTLADGITGPGDTVTYRFTVRNTGNVRLDGVTVTDPLTGLALSGTAIDDLRPGETDATTFSGVLVLTQADLDRGFVENSATARGNAVTSTGLPVPGPGGQPLTAQDVSDAGTDPVTRGPVADPGATETANGVGATDGDPGNDPTVLPLDQRPSIALVKVADASGLGDPAQAGETIRYSFTVTNTGNVTLTDVTVADILPGLALSGGPIASLAPGASDSTTFTATYPLRPADLAAGRVENQATATGRYGPIAASRTVSDRSGSAATNDAPTVVSFRGGVAGGLTLTKSAGTGTASLGDVVTYTILATNPAGGLLAVVDVVDRLPNGLAYVEGTARVDGAGATATVAGDRVVVPGVTLNPGTNVAITLDVRVSASASPGELVNVAVLLDPNTGAPVSPEARATLRIRAEGVLHCATVIGRVFDDPNLDGYMSEALVDRSRLTDQGVSPDGKFGPAASGPGTEPGLANVRLVAPDGLAVTTDAAGRFSLPCAALPQGAGSAFSLRLDERTLPTGYRLTTENPRVVTLTPGMITEMNFGATLTRVVRIDLSARAFDGTAPGAALADGLRRMVTEIASQPATLRITYAVAPGESDADARARVAAVERVVRDLWPANGRYAIGMESVLMRATGTE